MILKKMLARIGLLFASICWISPLYAGNGADGLGQNIQISADLSGYTGKPSWLLVVRDVDHNQTIPYVFDFRKNNNFWFVFTYSQNYLITASTLQFSPYHSMPDYSQRKIKNFCHLESHGHIMRGESLQITITGKLTPYSDTFKCHVTRIQDPRFNVVRP